MFGCPHAFEHPLMPQMSPYFQMSPHFQTPLYVFRCRNLALIFFSGMYVLHFGGMLTPPVYFDAPMHSDAPNAPWYVPNASLCICMFWGYLNRNGGCGDPPSVWTPPCVECLHICPTPPHIYMLPCMFVFQDHNMLPK